MKKLNINSSTKFNLSIALLLIGFAVASRFLPHAPNFAPVAAVALLGGAILPKKYALVLPLAAMVISDLFIGLHSTILFTWGSFALTALLSYRYLRQPTAAKVIGASLAASVLFFVVSNLGVWVEGRLYAHTLEGLIQCYYNALPFFRNTALSDLLYSGVLFGSYFAARYAVKEKAALVTH